MKRTDSKFKFETLLLHGLFAACLLICGLFMTAMVTVKPSTVQLASNHHVSATLQSAPSA